MRIALDPTPFHRSHSLLEFPRVVADLGYQYRQLTTHADFIPFYSSVFAEDDDALGVSRYQLEIMKTTHRESKPLTASSPHAKGQVPAPAK